MLVIIPARGGSKGIPRKNLVLLGGKPLIQYTIEAAQQSQFVTRIVLSTDDPEISELGVGLGLDLTYQRPQHLADDDTSMQATLTHCLNWVRENSATANEEFVLLQPTSPLRTFKNIDEAIQLYQDSKKNSLVSVNSMREHPFECVELKFDSWSYLSKNISGASRRQDYSNNYFYINGAIYIARIEEFLLSKKIVDEESVCFYQMRREHSIDIDDAYDLLIAQALLIRSRL
jgi:N-acylneuraminate cytidylyltransferase/CMP-N,N'-diacetyllegionaminic acid synthase